MLAGVGIVVEEGLRIVTIAEKRAHCHGREQGTTLLEVRMVVVVVVVVKEGQRIVKLAGQRAHCHGESGTPRCWEWGW